MKIKLALEWFINPDHLPFIVGLDKGSYKKNNIDLQIIEPEGHYDGFKELAKNNIQLARFIKKNMYGKKIVVGMGAGSISNWIKELPSLI